uniref:Uncharacterized protein n=1 Tax=Moniliophthora roreri TaxID=221103 RepID=A0A0W0FNG3_MONRR
MVASALSSVHAKINQNFDTSLSSGLAELIQSSEGIILTILMLDEIVVERRVHWDSQTNKFVGVCREHSGQISVNFDSEEDLDLLMEGLHGHDDNGEGIVHYATKATVAGIGILSSNKHVYSAHSIMISGTCKCEHSPEHAELIQLLVNVINKCLSEFNSKNHIISIASDGETCQGSTLAILTQKHKLALELPIYPHLNKLQFMDLLVGHGNVTGDKNYCYVFKCLQNLKLQAQGIQILDQVLTPSIIKHHFSDAGHSQMHIQAMFHPEDKQDIMLAYMLLHNIWSLPPSGEEHSLGPAWKRVSPRDSVWTMVGSNSNVNVLQLTEHITSTTEVANILAQKPEWDQTLCWLQLPIVDHGGRAITLPDKADHISPQSWPKEKLLLHTVNLQTLWRLGTSLLLCNETVKQWLEDSVRGLISEDPLNITILQPLGRALESNPLDPNNIEDNDESPPPISTNHILGAGFSQELEDAAGAEEVEDGVASTFWKFIMSKADRKKINKNIFCFNPASSTVLKADGSPFLVVSGPVVSVLACEGQIFLWFSKVIQVELRTELVEQIPLVVLIEDSISIMYQLLSLVLASAMDDESLTHDWQSKQPLIPSQFKACGWLVQPVDPTVVVPKLETQTSAFYLFHTTTLIVLALCFANSMTLGDARSIPKVARSTAFL